MIAICVYDVNGETNYNKLENVVKLSSINMERYVASVDHSIFFLLIIRRTEETLIN